MNKLIIIKLYYKLKFKHKKKRHKVFNIEINNNNIFFFLNSKEKKNSVMKLLFCLRRLSVKCLNLNKL